MTTVSPKSELWWRVALPFVLFVVTGSLTLILFLAAGYHRQSFKEFTQLANANAAFIRAAHIPPTERFADYLGQVLGVGVSFTIPRLNTGQESVSAPVAEGVTLTLVRDRPSVAALLFRPVTLGALVVFWGLSLALAWTVVRPYLEAQRLAMLGQMATALAHEIQNPVAAIRLHAQLAGSTVIVDEATTIESLVNQWMFLAKPEPPQKSLVKLDTLLADAVRALTPMAHHAHVQLTLDAAGDSVDADARRLGQAFRNIIVNAIQAMPAGGTLTITARDRSITFADTGTGFSPEALRRYAEMFFTEKEGGMGIGLSVTNEIIKAHGGRLTVANRPTGGAEVTITFQ